MDIISRSAQAAYEGATHADAKAENKYDTRGLESSYLAGAQKERALELLAAIKAMAMMTLYDFSAGNSIGPSALIGLEHHQKKAWYFLVSHGAGFTLTNGDFKAVTVTVQSPLGQNLLGREQGEDINLMLNGQKKTYTIFSII